MSTVLKINKQIEKIIIPSDDGEDVVLEVSTDDNNIGRTLHLVGNAMDKFATLQKKMDSAEDEAQLDESKEAITHLFKRCISAIVGDDGWKKILEFIGDGKAVDPKENILTLGEVFAALVTWLYQHCTSQQLRSAGVYLQRETTKKAKPRKRGKRK